MARDLLADGFVDLCIDPSLNFFDGACRVLIEGQQLDTATETPDTLVSVPNENDLNARFGQGSVLTEGIRVLFEACPENIEIFAIPRADPVGGDTAVYTLTVTGPATSAGRVSLFLGDADYSVDVYVPDGTSADDIAASLAAAISADFPYAATVGAALSGELILTSKNSGVIGNYLNPIFNWQGRIGYAPEGVSISVAKTTSGSLAPDALDYAPIIGNCCYDCWAMLSGNIDQQIGMRDAIRAAWSCDTPQCFGQGYTFNAGTLGGVLATGDNSAEWCRVAHCVDQEELPWRIVANYAGLSCCTGCFQPELSIQGRDAGVLQATRIPQNCTNCWSYDDEVQLKEAGFVVVGPRNNTTGELTNLYVYNDVTNYLRDELGRDNATWRDANSRRLARNTALEITEELQKFAGLGLFTSSTTIREGVSGTNPRMMQAAVRAWAKTQVGVLFSEFVNIDQQIILTTDFAVAPPCQGVPGKLHLLFKYAPPVRIGQINTNMQPKLLNNCDRSAVI